MSYSASAAAEVAGMRDGIPLDLAPLITPYRQHRRLTIRVVHLPARAELTRGLRNEDASWSLAPEDLDGLALILPEDAETPPSVAVRIVVVDRNENASIVGQFEVPLPRRGRAKPTSESADLEEIQAEWRHRLERRRTAAERLARRKAALAVATADADWRQKMAGERDGRAAAESRLGQAESEVARLQRELEAALTRDSAAEEAARAQRQAIEGQIAQEVETRLSAARAAWERETETRLAAAREEVRRAAEGTDTRLVEARAQWQMESEGQMAAREQALELVWRQKLQDAQDARQAAEARAEEATRAAERLAQEQAAAAQRLAVAEAAAAEAAAARRTGAAPASDGREAKALEARLAAARAEWRKESEARSAEAVAQAVRRTEAVAEARLRQAREGWEREAREQLAAAEGKWRAETARRLASAQAEWRQSAAAKATAGRRKLRGVARRQGWHGLGRKAWLSAVAVAVAIAGFLLYDDAAPLARQWAPEIVALVVDFGGRALAELRALVDALAARL